MAEQERLSKRERRDQARAERKRREAEAARKAKRRNLRSGAITALVLVLIGSVVYTALAGRDAGIGDAILVSATEAADAREAAGCEVVSEQPLPDRSHFEPADAPPADALYTGNRPTNSGSHYVTPHGLVTAGSDTQLDERATTHNLEHGAVIVWYDPEQVDGDAVAAIRAWGERLSDSGFARAQTGAGIFVSPYVDPGITSGQAVAIRAWGYSLDCGTWDETVANAFVAQRYGTHGIAPERNLGPYPDGVLELTGAAAPTGSPAPTGGASPGGASPAPSATTTPSGSPSGG